MMISCLHSLLPFLPVIWRVFVTFAHRFSVRTWDLGPMPHHLGHTADPVPGQVFARRNLPPQPLAAIRHGSEPLTRPTSGIQEPKIPAAPAGSAFGFSKGFCTKAATGSTHFFFSWGS